MKTIELNGKKYIIPEKWDEVSLKMQIKVSDDTEKITIDELKKFAILSGYANIPVDILKHAKITDLTQLFKSIAFINTPIPEKPIIEFDFNNKHYFVGQNLVDMEFQDFVSIENIIHEYSGRTQQALPVILAIMSKQKKANGILESIDDYNVMERAKEFELLPITIAHNLSLFFSNSVMLFSKAIPLFLNPEVEKVAVQRKIDEVENMLKQLGGKGLLTRCATGILRYCLKSIKRQQHKHFTSIQ